MYYSKLAMSLNHQQKNRQFQAFPSCEIIAIDRFWNRNVDRSFFSNITKYCFSSDLAERTTLKILKLNHR